MKRQTAFTVVMLVVLVFDVHGSASEPDRRSGNVAVNDVTVRDVQVRDGRVPPAQRPATAIARPFLPDTISRPDQPRFSPPSRDSAAQHAGPRRDHRRSGSTGYAVGFPVYPFVFERPTYSFYNPPPYAATVPLQPPDQHTTALAAGTPWFAAIDCGSIAGPSAPCGGLTFEVAPADAQVSIEGIFVGAADSFSPTRAPLVLSPGLHYVEVRRPGYRTEAFEVSVDAGSIVPYRGALELLRTR
jgi:hypothetical protein